MTLCAVLSQPVRFVLGIGSQRTSMNLRVCSRGCVFGGPRSLKDRITQIKIKALMEIII